MDMRTTGSETAFWLDFLDVPFVRHVEATFFEPHPEAFQRPTERDSAFRIPLATVLARRTGMHSVEIAKDVMPTIGLHAIRLPSGAATEKLHETANNIYAVVSGTVRATIDGQADEVPRTRRRSGSPAVAWPRSAWRRGRDLAAGH